MNGRFDTATIVGVGLLGGSLGLALKQRGLVKTVRGVGRRQSSLDAALAVGAVDETFLDLGEAVAGAGLVVLCTPATLVLNKLDAIRPHCSPSAVVTDVASTKGEICAHADATWTAPRRFVGSHPMAGSEKFGPQHATPDLYEGSVTVVEPGDGIAPDAHAAVCALWQAVGSRVLVMPPSRHDQLVARTSHLPHILAACIAQVAADAGREDAGAVAAGGFRDTTRVAAGRPVVWRDICLTNRSEIQRGLDDVAKALEAVRAMVAEGRGDDLEAFFQRGGEARKQVLGE